MKLNLNRLAVAIFFFVNGFLYANWTARLPELQRFYKVTNTGLGTFLLLAATGAIIAMPFTGWLTTRWSSRHVTTFMGLCFCVSVPFLSLSAESILLGSLFLMVGFSAGAMDVAMNGQAVLVERAMDKPIMSSFHAVFSIGMALGAGAGALFSKYNIGLSPHFFSIALAGFLMNLWASFFLVKDAMNTVVDEQAAHFILPTKAILPLGIIAFCGMTGEGSMADWSALFMHKIIGQDEAFSALAFGTFAASMTIGRIFGDWFTEKLGYQKLLIYDSILATIGLTIALIFATTTSTLIGFFLVGLGLSTIVPIVYSKAGNTPGVNPATGIAMATTIGYTGFFIGPPVIGFLADAYDLRIALLFTLTLFIFMTILVMKYKQN